MNIRTTTKGIFFLLLKVFGVLALLLAVLLSVAYALVSHNKTKIITHFEESISEKIQGKIRVADVGFTIFRQFPSASISLYDIHVQDSVLYKDVLSARSIFLQIDFMGLFQKQLRAKSIVVEDASFSVYHDSSGYSTLSAFQSQKQPADSPKQLFDFDLQKMLLRRVSFTFKDDEKGKDIHLEVKRLRISIERLEQTIRLKLKGVAYTNGLVFKQSKGPFLAHKEMALDLDLAYGLQDNMMVIHNSIIEIDSEKYEVNGGVDLNKKPTVVVLHIESRATDYKKALSILTPYLQAKLAQKVDVERGLSCQVDLEIPTNENAQPIAKVYFQIQNGRLKFVDCPIADATVVGMFSNLNDSLLPPSDVNSIVKIDTAKFTYNNIQFVGNADLVNLEKSTLRATINAKAKLAALQQYVDSNAYRLREGAFNLAVKYKGPLSGLLNKDRHSLNADIDGQLEVRNGSLILPPKHLTFSKININIHFDEKDVALSSLSATLNSNPLVLAGNVRGLLPHLLFPKNSMQIGLNLYSPHFDLSKIVEKKEPIRQKTTIRTAKNKPFMVHIERLIEHVDVSLAVDIHKFEYRRFKVNKLSGSFFMNHRELRLKKMVANFESGGTIRLNAKQLHWLADTSIVELKASIKNIKAPHLFFTFHNFNQAAVQERNLEGRIDADVVLACKMDKSHRLIHESMQGNISFTISNGKLKNFEPLKNISRLVFKSRDLSNISFDRISNKFIMKGKDMHIQKMQINSSAISLILEGVYSFRGRTNLSVKIPLSNLKKRHQTYYQIEEKQHGNLLLRAIEKDGKISFVLDPFNRFKKSAE